MLDVKRNLTSMTDFFIYIIQLRNKLCSLE